MMVLDVSGIIIQRVVLIDVRRSIQQRMTKGVPSFLDLALESLATVAAKIWRSTLDTRNLLFSTCRKTMAVDLSGWEATDVFVT